jgi:hypothetical protein
VLGFVAVIVTAGPIGPRGHDRPAGHADAYTVGVDPAAFTTEVDNPFFPLRPGTRRVYEGTGDGGEAVRTVIEVTSVTRKVMGVSCVVVHDTMNVDDKVVEDSFKWYAQDQTGNVWYFGENTIGYPDGRAVSAADNWEAGVGGAQAGVVMKANARVGDRYRQEYSPGREADVGEVLSINERTMGRFGIIDGVLKIRDSTPLEPDVVQHKYFAPGVGLILGVTVKGGSATSELVQMTRA